MSRLSLPCGQSSYLQNSFRTTYYKGKDCVLGLGGKVLVGGAFRNGFCEKTPEAAPT